MKSLFTRLLPAIITIIVALSPLFAPLSQTPETDPPQEPQPTAQAEPLQDAMPTPQVEPQPDLQSTPQAEPQQTTESVLYTYLPLLSKNYPRPATVFSVESHNIHPDRIKNISDIRASWLRNFTLDWSAIEPVRTSPPTYDWSSVEEAGLQAASENQIRVIATVKYTPVWARKVAGSRCSAPASEYIDEFAQFLGAAAARYGKTPFNLHYYEIGNEVDVDPALVYGDSMFGCWGDNSDPYYGGGYYATILKQVTPAIKAADPEAKVLTGGLLLYCDPTHPPAGETCKPALFLEGALRNGGANYFDMVSYHYFAGYGGVGAIYEDLASWDARGGGFYGKISYLQDVLKKYSVSKPLYLSEVSLTCNPVIPACSPVSADFLQKQANYVVWVYIRAWEKGLQGATWYTFEDSSWKSSGLYMGGTPKPAYYTYKFMARYLDEATYSRKLDTSTVGANVIAYEFRAPGKRIWVMWSATQNSITPIWPTGITAMYDTLGNPINPATQTKLNDPVFIDLTP